MARTSRVFKAISAVYDVIAAADFDTIDVTVALAMPVGEWPRYLVVVSGQPPQGQDAENVTMGRVGQNESFTIRAEVFVSNTGATAAEALADLEAIANVIQAEFRDQTTGRPIIPELRDDPLTEGVLPVENFTVNLTGIFIGAADPGFAAGCNVDIGFAIRI